MPSSQHSTSSRRHQPSQQQQPSIPTSVPWNRLNLDPEDVAALAQHQQLAHNNARSSAGSQASSQGRLLLDPGSLSLLSRHFDAVMQAIAQRLDQVCPNQTFIALYMSLTVTSAQ
jgi:hypothetical protein